MSLGDFGLLVSMNITKQCTLVEFLATLRWARPELATFHPAWGTEPEAEKCCARLRFWCDIARLSVLTTRNVSFPLFFVEIWCWEMHHDQIYARADLSFVRVVRRLLCCLIFWASSKNTPPLTFGLTAYFIDKNFDS